MRLSESYVNHFVKSEGIDLVDELDKLFNQADIQLRGSFFVRDFKSLRVRKQLKFL